MSPAPLESLTELRRIVIFLLSAGILLTVLLSSLEQVENYEVVKYLSSIRHYLTNPFFVILPKEDTRSIDSGRLLGWLIRRNQQILIPICCTAGKTLYHHVVSRFDPDSKKGATSMHQKYKTATSTLAMILSSVRYSPPKSRLWNPSANQIEA